MHHAESVPEQKKPSSSSANVIGQNDDLLTEILLLLPAKSLIRFKLVSKQWHSLISAASFCRLHILNHSRRHRCNPQHSFILGTTFRQYFVCDPTFKKLTRLHFPFANDIIIEQSCNGLLLLRSLDIRSYNYFIFNPTTMHHRKLFRFIKSRYAVSLHLLFDPSRSPHYKVIRFQRSANRPDLVYFYEYDSATHEWTREWTDCDRSLIPNTPWQFFYNSVSCNNRVYYIINGMSIAPFHYSADEKRVCLIQSSPSDEARGISKCIMESNGHVHYVRLSRMAANPSLDIYEMIDNKWVLCKSADQEQLKVALGDFVGLRNYVPELLGMMREERLEDSFVLVRVPGQIVLYSFSDKEDFRSHYFYEDHGPVSFVTAYTFIQSFAAV